MITFHTWPGPNSRKAQIMLEEAGAEYTTRLVDITRGEQFSDAFLAISPNNKVPAIVDDTPRGPVAVFETGAILTYLAERSGRLLSNDPAIRAQTFAWLHWGTGGLGGTLPHLHHYVDLPQPVAGTVERFGTEAVRLFKVLERRLAQQPFLAGDYSIADIPAYCSTAGWLGRVRAIAPDALGPTPSIDRWLAAIGARAAVRRVG